MRARIAIMAQDFADAQSGLRLFGLGDGMPTIAYFLGITVAMYYRDHNPPHIHVIYQGYEALLAIEDAHVLRGRLPPTALLIVRRWVTLRREALLANWECARAHQALERIAGPDDNAD